MTLNIQEIADGLTKGSKRAIVRISHVNFTEEGYPGPSRRDAYSLWWGRDAKHKLVYQPQASGISEFACTWRWQLTALGLQLRQHLLSKEGQGGAPK